MKRLPFLLFLVGVWFRATWFRQVAGTGLLMDELSMSRVLPGSLLLGDAPYNGATNLTASALWLAWEKALGLSPASVRSLSVVLGLFALAYLYRLVEEVESGVVALWTAAFLALSLNAGYFSSLAQETHFPLLWVPMLGHGFLRWRQAPSPLRSVWLGLVFALSLYSYPGQLLAVMAYGTTVAGLFAFQRRLPTVDPERRRGALVTAGTALLVVAGVFAIHLRIATNHEPLWLQNTGRLPTSLGGYFRSLALLFTHAVAGDVVAGGGFPKPMFELALWPFFFLGAAEFWRRSDSPWRRAIPLCLIPALLMAAFASLAPAARRLIFFLPAFYYFAALGVVRLTERLSEARSKRWLEGGLAVLLLAPVLWFHHGRLSHVSHRVDPYWGGHTNPMHFPPPEAPLLAQLAKGDVTLAGPSRDLEKVYLTRLRRLAEYLGEVPKQNVIRFTEAIPENAACQPLAPHHLRLWWCGKGLLYRRDPPVSPAVAAK